MKSVTTIPRAPVRFGENGFFTLVFHRASMRGMEDDLSWGWKLLSISGRFLAPPAWMFDEQMLLLTVVIIMVIMIVMIGTVFERMIPWIA